MEKEHTINKPGKQSVWVICKFTFKIFVPYAKLQQFADRNSHCRLNGEKELDDNTSLLISACCHLVMHDGLK